MEKQSFIEYGLSRYASQILQRFRHYTACSYTFFSKDSDGLKTLKVGGVAYLRSLQGETWDDIAYELNQYMRESSFKNLMMNKNKERMTFNEPNNNSLRPTYPIF